MKKNHYVLKNKFCDSYINVEYQGLFICQTRLASKAEATIFTAKAEAQRVKGVLKYQYINSRNFDIIKID